MSIETNTNICKLDHMNPSSISARFSHKPAQVLRGSIGKSLKRFSVLLIIVNLTSICQSCQYFSILLVFGNLFSTCQSYQCLSISYQQFSVLSVFVNIISGHQIDICHNVPYAVQLNRRDCSEIPHK